MECAITGDILLVGGAITILKNMKVNGKDYPIYYCMENSKMFEITNPFANDDSAKGVMVLQVLLAQILL